MKKCQDRDSIFLLVVIGIITIIFLLCGNIKTLSFCDEIYTYILSNSSNEFLNGQIAPAVWHSGEDIVDILAANEGFKFENVKINNAGDVHPPIYYMFFHFVSALAKGNVNKWIGLIVNYLCTLIMAIGIYYLIKDITKNRVYSFLTVVLCITAPGVISMGMLLRMYNMVAMWVVLFIFFTYKLEKTNKFWFYPIICIITFMGFLTQYYFSIFCVLFTTVYGVYLLINKKYKNILLYVMSLIMAVIMSYLYWPKWVEHMFSGYLGGTVKNNALNLSTVWDSVLKGFSTVCSLTYGKVGIIVMLLLCVCVIYFLKKKEDNQWLYVGLIISVIFYSILVYHLTPKHLLSYRYFYPVAALSYIILSLCIWCILKKLNKKICVILCIFIIYNLGSDIFDTSSIHYVDRSGDYKKHIETLKSVNDIPWIYYGYENSTMATLIYEATMASEFIMVNELSNELIDAQLKQCDEFVFIQGELVIKEDMYGNMEKWVGEKISYEHLMENIYVARKIK